MKVNREDLCYDPRRAHLDGHSEFELLDPHPDIRALFVQFDKEYFWSSLGAVEVLWSSKMTLCAGLCEYKSGGCCTIKLSEKLLQFRSRKEMHEMIHAYLFVTKNNRDREAHGAEFVKHMQRLNHGGSYNISIYHTFHAEVDHYRLHHWQCQGKCQRIVKRAMNRVPDKHDVWWPKHLRDCGGDFKKIQEPPPKEKKKEKVKTKEQKKPSKLITSFFKSTKQEGSGDEKRKRKRENFEAGDTPVKKPKVEVEGGSKAQPILLLDEVEETAISLDASESTNGEIISISSKGVRESIGNNSLAKVSCPVCTTPVPLASLNDHLDFCLLPD